MHFVCTFFSLCSLLQAALNLIRRPKSLKARRASVVLARPLSQAELSDTSSPVLSETEKQRLVEVSRLAESEQTGLR